MAGIGLTDYVYPLGAFYILEDIYLKGGYRTVADTTARDAIPSFDRKEGMLVWTIASSELYKMGAGLGNGDWALYAPLPPSNSVTNAMLVNVSDSTIKGRAVGAGTGSPQDLTATQATAILNALVGDSGAGGTKGLAPAPSAGDAAAGKYLKADGTWAVPPGSGSSVYRDSFTDADLSAGVLTVTHSLGARYNLVSVYDNNDRVIYPDQITDVDANSLTVDLTSFQAAGGGTLPGTWNVTVVS